jgi:hypothetical protein
VRPSVRSATWLVDVTEILPSGAPGHRHAGGVPGTRRVE